MSNETNNQNMSTEKEDTKKKVTTTKKKTTTSKTGAKKPAVRKTTARKTTTRKSSAKTPGVQDTEKDLNKLEQPALNTDERNTASRIADVEQSVVEQPVVVETTEKEIVAESSDVETVALSEVKEAVADNVVEVAEKSEMKAEPNDAEMVAETVSDDPRGESEIHDAVSETEVSATELAKREVEQVMEKEEPVIQNAKPKKPVFVPTKIRNIIDLANAPKNILLNDQQIQQLSLDEAELRHKYLELVLADVLDYDVVISDTNIWIELLVGHSGQRNSKVDARLQFERQLEFISKLTARRGGRFMMMGETYEEIDRFATMLDPTNHQEADFTDNAVCLNAAARLAKRLILSQQRENRLRILGIGAESHHAAFADPAIIRKVVELFAAGKKVLLMTNDASVAIRSMGICDDLQIHNNITDEEWDRVYAPYRPMVFTFDDLKLLDNFTRQYHYLYMAAGKAWMEDIERIDRSERPAPLQLWMEAFRPGDKHRTDGLGDVNSSQQKQKQQKQQKQQPQKQQKQNQQGQQKQQQGQQQKVQKAEQPLVSVEQPKRETLAKSETQSAVKQEQKTGAMPNQQSPKEDQNAVKQDVEQQAKKEQQKQEPKQLQAEQKIVAGKGDAEGATQVEVKKESNIETPSKSKKPAKKKSGAKKTESKKEPKDKAETIELKKAESTAVNDAEASVTSTSAEALTLDNNASVNEAKDEKKSKPRARRSSRSKKTPKAEA